MATGDLRRRLPSGILSFEQFQRTPYFEALDGWRAISILVVILFHSLPLQMPMLPTFQANGRYGVSFFFAISGFLITTLFLREESNSGRVDLWKFYGRRALRLLPLYYAVLMLESAFVLGFNQYSPANQQLFREKLVSYLFYHSNWLKTSGVGPFFYSWSLAVEEQFYLAFGFLFVFCPRRILIWLAGGLCLAKPTTFYFFGPIDGNSVLWRIVFSYHEPILMGVLTAFLLHHRASYALLARILGSRVVFGVVLLSLCAVVAWYPFEGKSSVPSQGLYLLMVLTLIGSVIRPSIPIINSALFVHWGKISYGMYLLHMFVLIAVRKYLHVPAPLILLLALAGVTVIATLSYKYFEAPIIALSKKRLSVRRLAPHVPPILRPAPEPALPMPLKA